MGRSAAADPPATIWQRLVRQIELATRRSDAEDLLQEARARLLARVTCPDNVEAFLVRAAINTGRDAYRRERVRVGQALDDPAGDVADPFPLQDEVLIMRARLDRVREGVERLSPRTREVFLMQRIEGCTYREIATRLAISQSAVEKHMAKAMTHLAAWTEHW
ncbi:RNA polymerase sigma factor [Sphingomonas sp. 1P08PE]|uniref:RNA polymerase sigma factor n=1 Tax=Sphingomonas sp. 1P08PE TaxID=554122 RepID=UPI0039A34119